MSASADKLRARVDAGEELEARLMAEIEEALDTANLLAESAVIQLDKLTADKKKNKSPHLRLRWLLRCSPET